MSLWKNPILSLILIAGCTTIQSEEPRILSDDEAIYLSRFEARQKAAQAGGGLSSYDPLETVDGASQTDALALAPTSIISKETHEVARAYAAERNSSSLLIWQGDMLVHESYFGATEQDTLINSKSLAKPLGVIAIGRAIKLGYIDSLDQPAADFLHEWRGDAQKSKITIRHLLGMRSGLLPQGITRTGPEDVLNRAYLHPRHDEVIINEYPLTHEPGTRYEYSNANSQLVAPIIERATGERYGAFLTQAVFEPLGAKGGTVWVNRVGGTAHAGCCIQLPARTWLKTAILLLNDGVWNDEQILPEGFVDQMRTTTPQNPHAGLGVWVAGEYTEWRGSLHPSMEIGRTFHSEPYASDSIFLFDGNGNQVVYMIPEFDTVILRTGSFPEADKQWDNSFLPNVIVRDILDNELPDPMNTLREAP